MSSEGESALDGCVIVVGIVLMILSLAFLGSKGSEDATSQAMAWAFFAYSMIVILLSLCFSLSSESPAYLAGNALIQLYFFALLVILIEVPTREDLGNDQAFLAAVGCLGAFQGLTVLVAVAAHFLQVSDDEALQIAAGFYLVTVGQCFGIAALRLGYFGLYDTAFVIAVGVLGGLHVPLLVLAVAPVFLHEEWRMKLLQNFTAFLGVVAFQMLVASLALYAKYGQYHSAFHAGIGLSAGLLALSGIMLPFACQCVPCFEEERVPLAKPLMPPPTAPQAASIDMFKVPDFQSIVVPPSKLSLA